MESLIFAAGIALGYLLLGRAYYRRLRTCDDDFYCATAIPRWQTALVASLSIALWPVLWTAGFIASGRGLRTLELTALSLGTGLFRRRIKPD